MTTELKWINIAVIGPAQHGKSTLTGFTLDALGEVDRRVLEEARRAAEERGDLSRKYAFLLDRLPKERKIHEKGEGQTIETSWWGFEDLNSPNTQTRYLFIDSPGHYKHMVEHVTAALSHADAMVLVVDVSDFSKALVQQGEARRDPHGWVIPNAVGQIRSYLAAARFYDIQQIIVAVHKMDLVDFEQEAYENLTEQVRFILEEMRWTPTSFQFVPTAVRAADDRGYNIDRLDEKPINLESWYKGVSFVDALMDLVPRHVQRAGPFRMQVSYAYKGQRSGVSGYELVFTGKIISGQVKLRDELMIQPSGTLCRVRSIKSIDASARVSRGDRWSFEGRQHANAGQQVGLGCTIIDYGRQGYRSMHRGASSGDVVGSALSPPRVSRRLMADLLLLHRPPLQEILDAQLGGVFGMGYFKTGFKIARYSLDCGNTFNETSRRGEGPQVIDLAALDEGTSLPVEIILEKDAPLDPHLFGTELGRFVILDKTLFVLCGGKITQVL